jgi:UDPglucose 6-dehydrogenase
VTNITVVGTGYVGLATGATLAELGHDVTCLDVDEDKNGQLRRGHLPVYEPGLDRLVADNVAANRLHFTSDYAESVPLAGFIFIAVGTPPGVNGRGADLTRVCSAAQSILAASVACGGRPHSDIDLETKVLGNSGNATADRVRIAWLDVPKT